MRLRAGARTDTGRVRVLNEDVYVSRAEQGLFVVCDGMGGAAAGEVASSLAKATILAALDGAPHEPAAIPEANAERYLPQTRRLADAVRHSNQVIYDCAQRDARYAGMGTTVVGVWLTQFIASVAHVGDSRAYLWHNRHLEALTQDHSLVEARVQAGLIEREKSLESDQQNILLRVVGCEPDVEVDLNEVPVQVGDVLLLCSDGLTRMVPESQLGDAIVRFRDPQRICDYLITTANCHGGADNITVVVVEVAASWWQCFSNRLRRHAGGGRDAEAHPAV